MELNSSNKNLMIADSSLIPSGISGNMASGNVRSQIAELDSRVGMGGTKNKIINGDMVIDQRNSGAVQSAINNTYTIDRWVLYGTSGKFNSQQNAGAITSPVGFTNYLGLTTAAAYTLAAIDSFHLDQSIEGLNCRDLAWGVANAKPVTLSFQVYSSLTGIFSGSILNSASARSYPFSYTIFTANTWTSISVTIPGDTTGTWLTTTGVGIRVSFNLGTGTTYTSTTSNTWQTGAYIGVTGSVSVVGTLGATFYITGVQLEKGSVATSFESRHIQQELALCQRYYEKGCIVLSSVADISANRIQTSGFNTAKRATPTVALTSIAVGSGGTVGALGVMGIYQATGNSAAGSAAYWTADAEL